MLDFVVDLTLLEQIYTRQPPEALVMIGLNLFTLWFSGYLFAYALKRQSRRRSWLIVAILCGVIAVSSNLMTLEYMYLNGYVYSADHPSRRI